SGFLLSPTLVPITRTTSLDSAVVTPPSTKDTATVESFIPTNDNPISISVSIDPPEQPPTSGHHLQSSTPSLSHSSTPPGSSPSRMTLSGPLHIQINSTAIPMHEITNLIATNKENSQQHLNHIYGHRGSLPIRSPNRQKPATTRGPPRRK